MKKGLTELVFILDRSGSMAELTSDTIGGFNSMLEKQKKVDGEALVSTVLFNGQSVVVHDRVDIQQVERMTEEQYQAFGNTALIDAIGDAIHHIRNVHKYIREEDLPERTMFVITTDGLENASRRYSSDEVKKMVKAQQDAGWEFIFLGANIDAVETARHFGIKESMSINYHSDSFGENWKYAMLEKALHSYRKTGAVEKGWKEEAEADFQNRK